MRSIRRAVATPPTPPTALTTGLGYPLSCAIHNANPCATNRWIIRDISTNMSNQRIHPSDHFCQLADLKDGSFAIDSTYFFLFVRVFEGFFKPSDSRDAVLQCIRRPLYPALVFRSSSGAGMGWVRVYEGDGPGGAATVESKHRSVSARPARHWARGKRQRILRNILGEGAVAGGEKPKGMTSSRG